ncbi:MAG: hypothetical protein ABSB12_01985 [Candidatus Saccharimonadales bacterium]|jgi:hypothetical protein
MSIETITEQRDNYRHKERSYIRRASLALGALAVEGAYIAQHSLNTVVSHIGQSYNALPFDLTFDSTLGVLFMVTAYNTLKAISFSRRASTLDGAIAQSQLQDQPAPSLEVLRATGTQKD